MQTGIGCSKCYFTQVRKICSQTEEVSYCCAGCNAEVIQCRGCGAGLKEITEIDNGVYLVCIDTCGWEICFKGPSKEVEGPWGLRALMQKGSRYR